MKILKTKTIRRYHYNEAKAQSTYPIINSKRKNKIMRGNMSDGWLLVIIRKHEHSTPMVVNSYSLTVPHEWSTPMVINSYSLTEPSLFQTEHKILSKNKFNTLHSNSPLSTSKVLFYSKLSQQITRISIGFVQKNL